MRKKALKHFRDIVSWIIVLAMLINSSSLPVGAAQPTSGNQNEQVYECDGYTVTFKLETEWNSGYNAAVVIQNTGNATISDWFMYLKYDGEIPNMWNATIYDRPEHYYVLMNAGWNKDVYSDGTASFGFTGSGEFPGFPETIKVTSGYDPTALDGGDDHGDDGSDDIVDDGVDADADGLSDALEDAIGSDPQLVDTDGDGLSDYLEFYLTWTDPTLMDTDEDGIGDADEDADEDGLSNLDEITRGTDVVSPDSDKDDLSDYEEVFEYGTDPLIYDTDGDGLCDGDDVLLGFSPTMPDTDLNGVLDSAEKNYQSTENNFEYEDAHGLTSVSVSLDISGNIEKEIEITNVYDFDAQSREVVGIVGAPIEITSDVDFDTATISFSYDESALGDTLEENLSLMWYDEENNWYQILDQDCMVDASTNTVTYTTTHFSKYLLVDRLKWFEAWNGDEDYSDEPTELIYQPINYIVIEDTFSFQSPDDTELIEEIKNTLSDSSNAFKLYREGRIRMQNGLGNYWELSGDLNTGTREYFTEDGYTITPGEGIDHMTSPTYRSPNLNSILDSIVYSVDKYPDYFSGMNLIVIFISNRSSGASDEMLAKCADRGIKIYTIDILNDYADATLQNLSLKTNGSHYYGEITHNPMLLINSMIYVMNGFTAYGSDGDTDGLLDKYETNGVRNIIGKLIKTDPNDDDSDDDNLSDFEELGQVYDLNLYIGFGIFKNCRYVIPKSDPNLPDSDEDGLTDDVDPRPLSKDYLQHILSNPFSNNIYLDIDGSNGGNQNWWGNFTIQNQIDLLQSIDCLTSKKGCGVIAFSDVTIFLAQSRNYMSYPENPIPNWDSNGTIRITDYMSYAEYCRDSIPLLLLRNRYINGAYADDIVPALRDYLTYNGVEYPNVSYAASSKKAKVLSYIEKMISSNCPVICLFNSKDGQPLHYYGDRYDALNSSTASAEIDHHFMNIIGYEKCDLGNGEYKYLLLIESWGNVYYVNYDEYARNLGSSNNIIYYEI